jgi:hypothetical protein
VQPRPAIGTNLQPRSPDVPATVDPQPSSSAPQPTPADQDKDVFSALKRIPDLLRPDPPTAAGEAPRPPMPVGTASPEKEFEPRAAKVPVGRQKPGDIRAQLLSISS